ncbi:hypothetical protein AB0I41_32410, partial [Micromonospora sp. NPDC050200]
MNTIMRKSVLGIAGLAFAGGLAAGPLNHGTTTDTVDTRPVAAAVQAEKPAVDKPGVDKAKLIPHGVQGKQSHIDLGDEQTKNVKAIIAAT